MFDCLQCNKVHTLHVPVTHEMKDQIRKVAKELDFSDMSSFTRHVLDWYFNQLTPDERIQPVKQHIPTRVIQISRQAIFDATDEQLREFCEMYDLEADGANELLISLEASPQFDLID